jgi:polygalacturonase
VRCDNSVVRNVSIFGDWNTPNNDGIDITDSNNTVITDCHIDTGDDAICPKSTDGPLYNLTATNCWIRTKSCAVKFGSASSFNFGRLAFDNITIVDSHRGLGMQIRDGGMKTYACELSFSDNGHLSSSMAELLLGDCFHSISKLFRTVGF